MSNKLEYVGKMVIILIPDGLMVYLFLKIN